MKIIVTVDQKAYEVEIENLDKRPIVAIVEGSKFEVWPEDAQMKTTEALSGAALPAQAGVRSQPAGGYAPPNAPVNLASNQTMVRAPIPGVIVEIQVKAGDEVDFGTPLFVIEAMKMRNAIRASRPGTVKEILVAIGQTVNHNELLLEYAE